MKRSDQLRKVFPPVDAMDKPASQAADQLSLLTHKLSGSLLLLFSEMVSLLLSKGANNNAFDKKDGRALHWAAFMGERRLILAGPWADTDTDIVIL